MMLFLLFLHSKFDVEKTYERLAGIDREKVEIIQKSKGEFVLSIDSDMSLRNNVIEQCIKQIHKNKKIGAVIIPERSIGDNFWVKVRDFERSFYADTQIESARFFKKELIKKVGGYDENLVFFEESTLPQKIEKIGYNVKARIDAEILHHEELVISKWMKKKYYYGKSAQKYKEKYNKYLYEQTNIFYRYSIFLKNKRFYSKPIIAFGLIILKFLEYTSAGIGYLIGKKNLKKQLKASK